MKQTTVDPLGPGGSLARVSTKYRVMIVRPVINVCNLRSSTIDLTDEATMRGSGRVRAVDSAGSRRRSATVVTTSHPKCWRSDARPFLHHPQQVGNSRSHGGEEFLIGTSSFSSTAVSTMGSKRLNPFQCLFLEDRNVSSVVHERIALI